jgi:histidinol-phosphate aminotransferase
MSLELPAHIATLKAYQPGKPVEELERELGISGAIKIASNENPMGPSPKAIEAIREAAARVHLYPDGGCHHLRQALAERLGVRPEELVFGAGSNELIGLLVQAFCEPGRDEVLAHKYAFISYRLASQANNIDFVEADVRDDLGCDVDDMIARLTERTRILFLANPNNPTGAYLPVPQFERLLAALPERVVLVVDEAYHEFARVVADYPQSQRYREQRKLIVTLRTFSKIYGLAGLRVGYGIADAEVADAVNRVRRPFNINVPAQAAALAALDDDDHVNSSRSAANQAIAAIRASAESLGLRAYPSLGNFVLVDVGRDSGEVYKQLLMEGVIVRPMGAWGLPTCVRISVGTAAETKRVTDALGKVLA